VVAGQEILAEQSIVVGDTPLDVKSAHGAGMACLGVASHHFNADQLHASGADYVVTSLTEALPV
jgi:phosphoglycolate phosphatase-like HAD superfamily hydrolase